MSCPFASTVIFNSSNDKKSYTICFILNSNGHSNRTLCVFCHISLFSIRKFDDFSIQVFLVNNATGPLFINLKIFLPAHEKPPVYPQVTITQGGQTTIVTRMQPRFDEYQQSLVCPNCRANIVTRTVYKNGLLTWISAGVMFLLGLWCCCCIP